MSVEVKHRRGTTAEINSVTPALAEIGMDTSRKKFRFGDGATQGGHRLARENWRDSAAFTLSANTDDWAPTAFEELGLLIVTTADAYDLTGLAGGAVGRDIEIRLDPASTGSLTIKHQSASSTAGNRFNCPNANDILMIPGSSVVAAYDAANSRWLVRGLKAVAVNVTPAGVQQDTDVGAVLNALANRLPRIIARSTTTPPGAPANGDSYIVPASATDAWSGQEGKIATYVAADDDWSFTAPEAEQYVISIEDQRLMRYSGTEWVLPAINFYLSNELTPSEIATDASNYNPTGFYNANVIRFSVDQNGRKINSLAGGDAGQYKVFQNVGTANAVFVHEDVSSTAANRLTLGKDLTVRPGESITLRYDATTSRWLIVARSVATFNEFQSEIFYTGIITPAIAADQNNWAPTGIANANTVYLNPSEDVDITGLAGGEEGRELTFFNLTEFTVTLKEQSVSSTAANRFNFGGDMLVRPYQSTTLRYSGTINRWIAQIGPSAIALGVIVDQNTADIAAIKAGTTPGVNDTLLSTYNSVLGSAAGLAIALG